MSEEGNSAEQRLWKALRKTERESPANTYAFETRLLARLREERKEWLPTRWFWRLSPFFLTLAVVAGLMLPGEIRAWEDSMTINTVLGWPLGF